jgi:hypothetical protein
MSVCQVPRNDPSDFGTESVNAAGSMTQRKISKDTITRYEWR